MFFLKSSGMGMSKPDSQDPTDNHGSAPQLAVRSTDPCQSGNVSFQQEGDGGVYARKCTILML